MNLKSYWELPSGEVVNIEEVFDNGHGIIIILKDGDWFDPLENQLQYYKGNRHRWLYDLKPFQYCMTIEYVCICLPHSMELRIAPPEGEGGSQRH
jgi:hypothetical protein